MANLHLSYQHEDETLARAIEQRLVLRGHSFKIPSGSKPSWNWREKFLAAQENADAVVILLTTRGLSSPYILGEVGIARAYGRSRAQLMLPVLVGDMNVPNFVSDVRCFELPDVSGKELDTLAEELNDAIEEHVQTKSRAARIFISHRHRDERLASALVSVLESAFHIGKADVRCTSVKPYALPAGERISDRLRADINGAELVIGLIGPETADSRYVLFELGASWGRGVPTFPVLVRRASKDDIPGPLSERHSVSLDEDASCLQLMDDIAEQTSLQRRQGVTGRVAAEARELVTIALASKIDGSPQPHDPASPPDEMPRMAQHIANYLRANEFSMMSFERIRANINASYSDTLLRELIDKQPEKFRRATLKGGKSGIALVSIGTDTAVMLQGEIKSDRRSSSSWIALSALRNFRQGQRLRFKLSGSAGARSRPPKQVVIRLLRDDDDESKPIGIITPNGISVPENGVVDLALPADFPKVRVISVHGGPNPWERFPFGGRNGSPRLVTAEVIESGR
jgi:hypothetical protein